MELVKLNNQEVPSATITDGTVFLENDECFLMEDGKKEKLHRESEVEKLKFKLKQAELMIDKLNAESANYQRLYNEEGIKRAQFETECRQMLAGGLGTFEWLGKGRVLLVRGRWDTGTWAQIMERLKRFVKFDAVIALPEDTDVKALSYEDLEKIGLKRIEKEGVKLIGNE